MRKLLLACAAAVGFTGAASAAELATSNAKVEPGKMVVRLDTALQWMVGFNTDKLNNDHAGNKNNPYAFDGYLRLYPSMDGETTSGIIYGAHAEIRANSGHGGGASANSGKQTLYIRRAWINLGTATAGTVLLGQRDGVFGLMSVGNMQMVGQGGINGDAIGFLPYSNASYIWQFPFSVGNEYASSKITYLSPSFAGFDFGISFAPSTTPIAGGISAAAPGGGALATSSATDGRPTNILELMARYRGTFSGVGVAANVGYMTSGKVGGTANAAFRGLSIVDAGLQATYMGLTVGGHMSTGRFNGQTALSATGEKDSMIWIIGANYEVGPWSIGAHYYNGSRPGTIGDGVQRKDSAFSAGVNYDWAPGAEAFIELATGTQNEGATKNSGTAVVIGQHFRW